MASFTVAWQEARPIALDAQQKLTFERPAAVPGVYRFRLQDQDGLTTASFTGEAENLRQRIAHHRKPGPEQFTIQRLNAAILAFLARPNVSAVMEVVASARCRGSMIDMASPAQRRMLERALIVGAPGQSLNR